MKEILDFLRELKDNNNREWFDLNRDRYQHVKKQFEDYLNLMIVELSRIDPSIGFPAAKDAVFRFQGCSVFKGDKLPYKTNFGML